MKKNNNPVDIMLQGKPIERKEEPKLLGLLLDTKLKFAATADRAISKIYKKLALVRRMPHIREKARYAL